MRRSITFAGWLAVMVALSVPALAMQEVGVDDQRLSFAGGPLDSAFDAFQPAVAYNAKDDRYIACWWTDDLQDNEYEINCSILTTAGAVLLDDAEVSFFGPTGPGSAAFDAFSPDVVYNSSDDEYLVCWEGDTTADGQVDEEFEIFCTRLSNNGTPLTTPFRVSDQGGLGDANEDANHVSLAYNFRDNNYLVCWDGDRIFSTLAADGEFEIYCRLVNANGSMPGSPVQISVTGTGGDPNLDAQYPNVVYGSTILTSDEFLVCWDGDDDSASQIDGESEISCRRVGGASGTGIGSQVRLSHQGPDLSASYDAQNASVSYDPLRGRYLVCWLGDDNAGSQVSGELEVYCGEWNRSLGATVAPTRISFIGSDGDTTEIAGELATTYNGAAGWGVCWVTFDTFGSGNQVECQLLGQQLDRVGPAGNRVSAQGTFLDIQSVDMVRDPASGEWFVSWDSDTATAGLADYEYEVFAQRVAPAQIFVDGFESNGTAAWSAKVP